MFSEWFFVWACVGAVLFAACSLTSGGGGGRVASSTLFGAVLGWILSALFMPATGLFFLGSVFTAGVLWAAGAGFAALTTRGGGVVPFIGLAGAFALFLVLAFGSGFSGFHAQRYAALLPAKQSTRDTAIPLVDQSQARLVTDQMARKRAAELLSSIDEQGIGTRVDIGEMWGNEIGGRMYWIAPLEHSGFFRWLSFGTTPGYIKVSQFNEVDADFVMDRPIRIGVGAWMSDNVYRRLYLNGYVAYRYGDAMFQVDDAGDPYWIVPLLEPQVGYSGTMPVRWALVNAMDGAIQDFDDPAKLPEWVDRAYPQDIVASRFDDWGCLGQGWIACRWTGQNVIESTPGINVTIDASGDIVYFSGTQYANAKSEGASSGLYVSNARTGETVFYPRAGITETTAKAVMNQAYANFPGYEAAEPILLSLNGAEAYFSVIIDASGVRKGFALVAQDNRNILGIGNSVQAAVTEYNRALQRSGRDAAFEPGTAGSETAEGLVVTYTPYVQNGRTVFYLTIDTLPNKVLEVAEEKIGEIVATRVGDPVRVTSDSFRPGVAYVTGFDNLRFDIKEEGLQEAVDKSMGDAKKRHEEAKERANAAALVEKLSPEDLDALLEGLRNRDARQTP